MSAHIALTSQQLVLFIAGLFALVVLIILAGRYILNRRSKAVLQEKYSSKAQGLPINGRSKYPDVDIFRFRGIITGLGFVLALSLIVGLFGWTTYENTTDIPIYDLTVEEDITIEPPRTAEPPPTPPPPPPPVIEEVPDEMIIEEEQVTFMDQSIEAESVVTVPEEPVETKSEEAPPSPPPPPPPKEEVEEIFKVVEEMPRFPGCEDLAGTTEEKKACADEKLLEFIYSNIKYPALALENSVQGNVVVSFVVNRDGTIEQIKLIRDIGAGCGEEAVRVINLMREKNIRWIPGKQRGMSVRVQFLLPVKFKLVS